jgi:hypothetical protein
MSETKVVSRRQFFDEVWSMPLGQMSKKYGLSTEALVRACTRHQVPRPPRGYWTSKRAGWASPPPTLGPLDDQQLDSVTLSEEHLSQLPGEDASLRHAVDEEVNRCIEAELAAPPIIVPSRLVQPHPFVATVLAEGLQQRADDRVRRLNRPIPYQRIYDAPRLQANVSAHSAGSFQRACRIMDTLLKAMEARGYQVSGSPDIHGGRTEVTILGVKFDVRLYEPLRREIHLRTPEELESDKRRGGEIGPRYDRVATGRLRLEFRTAGGWTVQAHRQDGDRMKLEATLSELIVAVLRKVDAERQTRRVREEKAAVQRQEQDRQRREQERLNQQAREQQQERLRVEALLAEVKRWRECQEIRLYADQVRRIVTARGTQIEHGSDLDRWLNWVGRVADRLDPLLRYGSS